MIPQLQSRNFAELQSRERDLSAYDVDERCHECETVIRYFLTYAFAASTRIDTPHASGLIVAVSAKGTEFETRWSRQVFFYVQIMIESTRKSKNSRKSKQIS